MDLIIIKYNTGDVDIIRNLPDDINDLSFFIMNTLGYHLSEISYMVLKGDSSVDFWDWNEEQRKMIHRGYNYF